MRLLTEYSWSDEDRAYLIAAVLEGRLTETEVVVSATKTKLLWHMRDGLGCRCGTYGVMNVIPTLRRWEE